jgi:hypothetical protein
MRPAFTLFAVVGLGCACEGALAPPDATFDAPGLDAAIDAYTPPPFEPTLIWRAEGAGTCPVIMTPVWDPPSEPPIARGQRRWGPGGDAFTPVVTPTLLADGTSLWTSDLYEELVREYATADRLGTRRFRGLGSPPPVEGFDTQFRYRLPRMTLGRSTVVSRDLWSLLHLEVPGATQRWIFPELDTLFAAERSRPLPALGTMLEHSMPAWNPVTGQLAFTVGLENQILAVQCPGDNMGQFMLNIGPRNPLRAGENPYTHIFYRENGELLLHRNGQLHVISPTGEVLRSVSTGAGARPHTYDPTCGMFFQMGEIDWSWWNVDTMSPGPVLHPRYAEDGVSGAPDCGLREGSRDRLLAVHPDGTASMLSPGGVQVLFTAEGYLRFSMSGDSVEVLDARGVVLEAFALDGAVMAASVFTPDGNMLSANTRWYLGYAPGLPLYLNSGMNWAHTNSPLPE